MNEDLYKKQEEIRKLWIKAFCESPINTNKYIDTTNRLVEVGKEIAELENTIFHPGKEVELLKDRWRKECIEKRKQEKENEPPT